MAPLIVLVVSVLVLWAAGQAGIPALKDPGLVLRAALGTMFFLTASAHWGKRRADLVRMVPPAFPRPDILVTVTGVLEIAGAVGLFVPMVAPAACICLALLLLSLFPANVHAARNHFTIAGQRVPSVPTRAAIQLVFIAALIAAARLS